MLMAFGTCTRMFLAPLIPSWTSESESNSNEHFGYADDSVGCFPEVTGGADVQNG